VKCASLLQGSYAGNAAGFHLQNLEVCWTTKSEVTNASVLDYLVRNYSDVTEFVGEFENIKIISRVNIF